MPNFNGTSIGNDMQCINQNSDGSYEVRDCNGKELTQLSFPLHCNYIYCWSNWPDSRNSLIVQVSQNNPWMPTVKMRIVTLSYCYRKRTMYRYMPLYMYRYHVIFFFFWCINSFAANVADRRRHSRMPTSPIGDLDSVPRPSLSPFVYRHYAVFKLLLTLILQI